MTKLTENNPQGTANIADDRVLASGFRSKREQKKFAKLIVLSSAYQANPDWESQVDDMTKDYCEEEAKRLGFPDGWKNIGTYDELKRWFFQACR